MNKVCKNSVLNFQCENRINSYFKIENIRLYIIHANKYQYFIWSTLDGDCAN